MTSDCWDTAPTPEAFYEPVGPLPKPSTAPRRRTKSRFLRAYLADPMRAHWTQPYLGRILRAYRAGWRYARAGGPYVHNPYDSDRNRALLPFMHAWNAGWCLARPSLHTVKYL